MRRGCATVLVGPSVLLREGVARILGKADYRIVASGSCLADLDLAGRAKEGPMFLVVDAGRDVSAAVEQMHLFKEQYPAGRMVVLSDHDDPSGIASAFRAGANAVFNRITSSEIFIKALELVMLGETIVPATVFPILCQRMDGGTKEIAGNSRSRLETLARNKEDNTPRLSEKELLVMRCLAEGHSNKVIARRIKVAEATVKCHIKAILRKLRVHNRVQAAIWATNNLSLGERLDAQVGNFGQQQLRAAPVG